VDQEGLVVKTTGSWHSVKNKDGIIQCKAAGKLKTHGIKATNPITVGDQVAFRWDNENDVGLITAIRPRRNYIIRKSIKLSKQYHLIAANIDQALLIVSTMDPKTPREFIDRYLLTTEAYEIETKIIFNKTDLPEKEKDIRELENIKNLYGHIGYECISVSALEGTNMDMLKNLFKNRLSLLSGNSGVGKSTILNKIDPTLNLKVTEISKFHKTGKHTTTFSELFELKSGGYVIDTPGIRGFGLIDIEKNEVGMYFKEIFKASAHCSYHNCSHTHEPDCYVKQLVAENEIAESRYKSYLNIFNDENEKYR
jgi:ribosome biogenesis GTPase